MKRLLHMPMLFCSLWALGQINDCPGTFNTVSGWTAQGVSCTIGTAGCVTAGCGIPSTYSANCGNLSVSGSANAFDYTAVGSGNGAGPHSAPPGYVHTCMNWYTTGNVASIAALQNGQPNFLYLIGGGGVALIGKSYFQPSNGFPGVWPSVALAGFNTFEINYGLQNVCTINSAISAGTNVVVACTVPNHGWFPNAAGWKFCIDSECPNVTVQTGSDPTYTLTLDTVTASHAIHEPGYIEDSSGIGTWQSRLQDVACW